MNLSNKTTPLNVANLSGNINSYVPYVPLSASFNLVAAGPLAKKLAAIVLETSPDLAKISMSDFIVIQCKKTELRSKVDECSMNHEAILDTYLLNVEDLFSHLTAYLIAVNQVAENNEDQNSRANAQISLQLIREYAAVIGLTDEDYCKDGAICPAMLFEACLKRLTTLQMRWKSNYIQSMELALQLQRDAVYCSVASCLTEICQDGLANQITIDPMPLEQENVFSALATREAFPFSGEWPEFRQRVIVSESQTDTGIQGGMQ